jgi:hypothetical protein
MDESFKESRLPESNDEMWTILGKTKILVDEEKWTYSAIHPQEVKDLKGKTITISGFMLPLEPTEKFRHFLLSKQIPTCPFCPPGEPNEVIEVYAKKPTRWIEDMTTYSGTFVLINDGEKGLFFRMIEAEKK